MARLIAKSPFEALLPVEVAGCVLSEVQSEAITSVAPFAGQEEAVSAALLSAIGAGFPAPDRMTSADGVRIVWTGRAQAMVLGPAVAPAGAAVTDQSDAWAVVALDGSIARQVLARLVPIDLRDRAFPDGASARTMLAHMTCTLMRTGAERYEIMVFRSMAATAVHDLSVAMKSVAAQG